MLGIARQASASAASVLTPRRVRAVRAGLSLAGIVAAVLVFWQTVVSGRAVDAHAYWAATGASYATANLGGMDAFHYSPVFLAAMAPLHALPWSVFLPLWTAAELAVLAPLAGPIGLLLVLVPPFSLEITSGNIEFPLALAVLAGFRYPAAWSFVLLTKVTPGVGLLWFAVRREWHALTIALGATVALVIGSALLAPALWPAWWQTLARESAQSGMWPLFPVPLAVRVVGAGLVVAWGGWTDRRWTVVVASTLALPLLWPMNLTMLLGVVPLVTRAANRSDEYGPVRLTAHLE